MNRTTILIAIAAAVGVAAGWWLAGRASHGEDRESAAAREREILYWVAPMDPAYRRDGPGKSPMGMDLVPVYADAGDAAGPGEPSLRIDPAVVNNIGVKTARAQRGTLYRRIETVGFITPNEHRVSHVHVRSEGWIEHLAVHTEGARVTRGDVLFRLFAPALTSAQEELQQALQSANSLLVDASRRRLLALGLLPDQIEQLRPTTSIQRLIDIKAQQSGHVTTLNVRHGMFVTPSLMVMSIADLSQIWVDVDVFESQIGWVEAGQPARMQLPFAPQREWLGEVDYVYPQIRVDSRTARVRLVFDNPDLTLKPDMYTNIVIDAAPRRDVVHVPRQAVIRSGGQERIILALGDGRFRPAQVRTGIESAGRVEIREGLAEGETVVISSQFLLDSEASMDASLLRMIGQQPDGTGRSSAGTAGATHRGHATGATDDASDDGGMAGRPGPREPGEGGGS